MENLNPEIYFKGEPKQNDKTQFAVVHEHCKILNRPVLLKEDFPNKGTEKSSGAEPTDALRGNPS